MKQPSIVMIDNYDSFTYNLVQYFQQLDCQIEVLRNDATSPRDVIMTKPDAIVISPGPSDPEHAGISLALIRAAADSKIPLLGVCLGHQAIGQAFGGKVKKAPVPVHGKPSDILHKGQGIFRGLPSPLKATRYHSLIVERSTLPSELEVTGETTDGLIMGLKCRYYPIQGVQFHPESVLTDLGMRMLENFVADL